MRNLAGLVLLGLVASSSGCAAGRRGMNEPRRATSADARDAMGYGARRPGPIASAVLQLPAASSPDLVRYEVVGGMAVMEGDILLGPADTVAQRFAPPSSRAVGFMPVKDGGRLWPGGVIPYETDATLAAELRPDIDWAAGELAAVGLTVRPRTAQDTDYVVFRDDGSGCNAHLGRQGGRQMINLLPTCRGGAVLHELMHAAGVEHEHVRSDRDAYVTIVWDEIDPSMRFAFEKASGRARDAGPYDFGSIMHYGAKAFSRRGQPTIVAHQAGVEIGQLRGLSALDGAGIRALYPQGHGGAPANAPWASVLPPGFPQPPPGLLGGLPMLGSGGSPGGGGLPGWPAMPQGWGGIVPGSIMPEIESTPAGLPAGLPAWR